MSKVETYACTLCSKEVPWYENADGYFRAWEYANRVCSRCRVLTMAPEERDAMLPKPTTPCTCGSMEFLRAPLQMHVAGTKQGDLYVLACRACGRAEIFVLGAGEVPIQKEIETEVVRVGGSGGPYR